MQTYKVGAGTQQIMLSVDIDTVGLAATRARLVIVQSTEPGVTVATSSDATGDILPQKKIGARDSVVAKRLSVVTRIDLLGKLPERKAEAERLTGTYQLDGGPGGSISDFEATKKANKDFTSVGLQLLVDLIP
jgi:hypothetical protein